MAIPPLIGNPYNGYINPYYWVDDHPLLYGNNGSLDPGTFDTHFSIFKSSHFHWYETSMVPRTSPLSKALWKGWIDISIKEGHGYIIQEIK